MKKWILFIALTTFLNLLSVGQQANNYLINEFQVSLNRSLLQDANTADRFGFGVGIYHAFGQNKTALLVAGIEYNRGSQFKENMYHGPVSNYSDVVYTLNCLSLPLTLRVNLGPSRKFFVETGGFADFMLYSNQQGTSHNYGVDENNQLVYTKGQFDQNAHLPDSFGLSVGLGFRLAMANYAICIKPEYKIGLTELYDYQDVMYNRYLKIALSLQLP